MNNRGFIPGGRWLFRALNCSGYSQLELPATGQMHHPAPSLTRYKINVQVRTDVTTEKQISSQKLLTLQSSLPLTMWQLNTITDNDYCDFDLLTLLAAALFGAVALKCSDAACWALLCRFRCLFLTIYWTVCIRVCFCQLVLEHVHRDIISRQHVLQQVTEFALVK